MTFRATPRSLESAPGDEASLEERLSRPSDEVVEALRVASGDVVVLGAGGKMGPSLTAMLARAVAALGHDRQVHAVSRWSDAASATGLEALGVRVVRADLLAPEGLGALPDAPNVILMAAQKFGPQGAPWNAWMTNTVLPARAAERYRASRIVAFSTGNVYPLVDVRGPGSREDDRLGAPGEYAQSCVGRERVLQAAADRWGTRVSILRLNYAVDLRYGVLVDVAQRLLADEPIDLSMGYVNCIWQGDANAVALRALAHAAAPPFVVNLTGTARLSVREVALELGRLLGREPRFSGAESSDALLSDSARMVALFGEPAVTEHTLMAWVAEWLRRGGRTLGKATRFERRDGAF